MKRLLLATAAVIALSVAAPLATAQYTTPPPATAPYTTPVPDDPATPADESVAAQPDTLSTQPQSTLTTPGAPELQDPPTVSATQSFSPQGQVGVGAAQAQAHTGMSAQTDTGVSVETHTAGQAETQSYDAMADSGMGENTATFASLEQHARDAGMDGLPMTPQEVCMPREIALTMRGTSLPRDKEHQLINAADRASVCEFQRVIINSPTGRADEARQLLIAHGVDAGLIEIQDVDTGGLEIEMQFAGIATSSEQYAQLFNPQQLASYQPGTAPGYNPSMAAPGATYQPSPPPVNDPDPETPAPDADPMEDMDDGMSPTSGEPVVTPDMLDI